MKDKLPVLNIYILFLVSIFFDAYALFYIKTYPVTLFTIVSIIFFVQYVHQNGIKNIQLIGQNKILVFFIFYLIFNYVFFRFKNTTSFLQALYFPVLVLISYRREKKEDFEKYCFLFQFIMLIMAVYGIYQFLGRIVNLPLTDLIIKNHMVEGYNWTNSVYISGIEMYRSNAIFREPSYFGQMLAISILMLISILFSDNEFKIKGKCVLLIFVQGLALLTTLSGTGFLMLIVGFTIYCCRKFTEREFQKKIIPFFIFCVAFMLFFLNFTSIGHYFLNRMNELFTYNRNASSGFVRFRGWIIVVGESWTSNFLFGSGIGTGAEYILKYSKKYYAMTLNGFARVATELGLIGIITWIGYILSFFWYNKNTNISKEYLIICCSLVPMIFMHEVFSSNIFWMLIILLNCDLYQENEMVVENVTIKI